VADALSRDNDRTDEELTQILRFHCPSQLPQHFKIVPLPNEIVPLLNKIVSWLTLLLLRLPVKQQLAETHSTMKLGRGTATQSTTETSDSETTFSLKTCQEPTELKSLEVLPWLCIKGDFLNHVMLPWLRAQSLIPSTTWLRSSGKMDTTTQNGSLSATMQDFLRWQLISYKMDDPKEVQQKALPVCILRLILSSNSAELRQAMGELAGATHFWAMRSFEYAKVPKAEQRQMKQLCIRNIVFIKDRKSIDHKSHSLHLADCVSVTLE